MPLKSSRPSHAAIEKKIRELVDLERVLTFTALTTRLPDCRWIILFRALNHLEKQRAIRLIPIPWDYQICAASSGPLPVTTASAHPDAADAR